MKKLGQHFLINKGAVKKIIDVLELKAGDLVVEVGPGHGELTLELAKHPIKVIAVEKDRGLAKELQFSIFNDQFSVIEGDILKELPRIARNIGHITHNKKDKTYKLVGNIPYYLTGYLLRIIGELENKPALIVFTIQKEVAERITARPPKMNLLAASVQYWADAEILDIFPAAYFQPKPKVESAIIKLKPIKKSFDVAQDKNYFNFIKIIFKQPRKTILNNLIHITHNMEHATKDEGKNLIKNKLIELGLNEKSRPGELDISKIMKLNSLLINPTVPLTHDRE